MWFDVQAALAEIEGGDIPAPEAGPPATSATSATKPARVAIVAGVATPPAQNRDPDMPDAAPRVARDAAPETFSHGRSVAGHPRTWTGRIVSLDAWRHLSEWEKHGPNGRHWCGIARSWIEPKGE